MFLHETGSEIVRFEVYIVMKLEFMVFWVVELYCGGWIPAS